MAEYNFNNNKEQLLQNLQQENELLKQHNQSLLLQITQMQEEMEQKDVLLKEMKQNLEYMSSSADKMMHSFMENTNTLLPEQKMPLSAHFLQSLELQNDKELLFGINIKQEFLLQSSVNTIKYYLFASQCHIKEEFEVHNLHIQTKEQLALVGEAFAQYVKLNALNEKNNLQGIVEILSGTIIDPPILKYYGDKSVERYFNEFVSLYSKGEDNKE